MFTSLLKAAVGVVVLPIDIAKDVVTLGGSITNDRSAVAKRAEHIARNIDKATR